MKKEIPMYIQKMVAGTNGNHYLHLIGKLVRLPIPGLPFWKKGSGYFLDLGSGWGRWCLAAAKLGFTPVGVDIKWEAAKATRDLLKANGRPGYAVVADLSKLPFADSSFLAAWSFSVLQHVHRDCVNQCLDEVRRVLRQGEFNFEIPLKTGLWNCIVRLKRGGDKEEEDPQSWCVRYYSLKEILTKTSARFPGARWTPHCYFGIGILPVDLRFVTLPHKLVVVVSLAMTLLGRIWLPLGKRADSIYLRAEKK